MRVPPSFTSQSTKRLPARGTLPASALALIALCFAGCAGPGKQSAVDRMLQHPEFTAAAQAAPRFTGDALHAIADLEAKR